MRQEQDPLPGRRVEAGDEVGQGQGIALGGDVGPFLGHQGVRTPAEQAVQPDGHPLVCGGPWNPGAERHLALDVVEGRRSLELPGPRSLVAGGEEQQDQEGEAAHEGLGLLSRGGGRERSAADERRVG